MSDFMAKMHQISILFGLLPRPHAYSIYSRSWWVGLATPFPTTPPLAVGPSGLELRSCQDQATFID